jgi:hypothetical protein
MPRPDISRWLRATLLSLLLATAGSALAQQGKWKFMVSGETRGEDTLNPIKTDMVAELARAVTNERPAFLVFLGDLAYAGGETAYRMWNDLMSPCRDAGIPVYPIIGNHDSWNLAGWTEVFGPTLPTNGPADDLGFTYFLTHSNALLLMLNQYRPASPLTVHQPWLDAVLATNSLPHVFAFGHVPAFKLFHTDCLGSYPVPRNLFWQSLTRAHARLYICGHDHFFDQARLDDGDGNEDNDLHQLIAGGGGAPIYPDDEYDGDNGPWIPRRLFHEPGYGYLIVEVDGPAVTSTWHRRVSPGLYTPTTNTFTYFDPPRPSLRFSLSGDRLVLQPSSTQGTLQAAADIHGPYTNVSVAQWPYPLPTRMEQRMFYRLTVP